MGVDEKKYFEFKSRTLHLALTKEEARHKDIKRGFGKRAVSKYLRRMVEEGLIKKILSEKTHKPTYVATLEGMKWYGSEEARRAVDAFLAILPFKIEERTTEWLIGFMEGFMLSIFLVICNSLVQLRETVQEGVERILKMVEEKGLGRDDARLIVEKALRVEVKDTVEAMIEAGGRHMAYVLGEIGSQLISRPDLEKELYAGMKPYYEKAHFALKIWPKLLEAMPELKEKVPELISAMELLEERYLKYKETQKKESGSNAKSGT